MAVALLVSQSMSLMAAQPIVVVGDSLSAAYQIQEDAGWVTLLSQKIQALYPDMEVVNTSVSGATTAAGLQRMPGIMAALTPAIVIIELGGNDGLQGKPLAHIKSNLESLIRQSLSAGAIPVLIGIRIPPNYGPRYTAPFYDQYAELAAQYKLLYVPFMLEGVADQPSLMQGDGIHPIAEAQPLILANLWPTIQQAVDQYYENRISR